MRPTNPLSIIHDKNKGKTSVVKPSSGIAKHKGKASVVKPKATVRKGKVFPLPKRRTLEEELS